MTNVTKFYPKDAAKDPNVVLEKAKDVYQDVLIIGWAKEDETLAVLSSHMTKAEINYLLDISKVSLLAGDLE